MKSHQGSSGCTASQWLLFGLLLFLGRTHKRLGDGYYKQQLIRDQLIQLTGQRYIGNHTEDEAQYRALINSGIAFGKQYQLQPGVALTPAQMALLTTDIIWLADRNVRLSDGSTQNVRVPQVYAKLKPNDLTEDGALLGGKQITLTARENILNSGRISGVDGTQLAAQNLTNSGTISSNQVTLEVWSDINNTGGQIHGGEAVSLQAGQDIEAEPPPEPAGLSAG